MQKRKRLAKRDEKCENSEIDDERREEKRQRL